MPRLNQLEFTEPAIEPSQVQSMDDLPETGSFTPMLQEGTYTFEMPANVDDAFDVKKEDGKPDVLQVKFDDQHPLKIVESPDPGRLNEPFNATVSSREYERTISGGKHKVRDTLYLLKRLGYKGPLPQTFQQTAAAIMSFAGKRFKAHVRNSWGCNANRNAYFLQYVVDPTTNQPQPDPNRPGGFLTKRVESQAKGCGSNYYPTRDVQKQPDGKYPEEIQCKKCGAVIRGFGNLDLTREV